MREAFMEEVAFLVCLKRSQLLLPEDISNPGKNIKQEY